MNAARILLAAVVVVGLVSTANAVNKVWWEAEPLNADSFVTQQGEGLSLDLQCGLGPVPVRCEWNVTMYLRNDQGISGWANDLGTMPDNDFVFIKEFEYMTWYSFKEYTGYYPFYYPNYAATPGSGDALLTGTAAFTQGTVGPPPAWYPNGWPLLRFTLSADSTLGWVYGWNAIHTTIGAWEWSGDTEDVWVEFGDNAPINANTAGATPAWPVIDLWIPEPATITLLGLGALFLARRRSPSRTPGTCH
jgi:hypothetical protein